MRTKNSFLHIDAFQLDASFRSADNKCHASIVAVSVTVLGHFPNWDRCLKAQKPWILLIDEANIVGIPCLKTACECADVFFLSGNMKLLSCASSSFFFYRTSESCTVLSVESPSPRRRSIKVLNNIFSPPDPTFSSNQRTLTSKNAEAGPSCCSHDGFQTSRISSISFILTYKLWCQILSCCQLNPFGLPDQNNQESFFSLPVFMNADVSSFIYNNNPSCRTYFIISLYTSEI